MKHAIYESAVKRLAEIEETCREGEVLRVMIAAAKTTDAFKPLSSFIYTREVEAGRSAEWFECPPFPIRLETFRIDAECADSFSISSLRVGLCDSIASADPVPAVEYIRETAVDAVRGGPVIASGGVPITIRVENTSKKKAVFKIVLRGAILLGV